MGTALIIIAAWTAFSIPFGIFVGKWMAVGSSADEHADDNNLGI